MNSLPMNNEKERVFFLDNVRYLLVFLVVVFHMTCSYSHYTTWWAVNDDNSVFFDYLLLFLDIFLMPVLFFIAGYFTLPSIDRRGTWLFIKNKIIRLGIPWLIGVFLLPPMRIYIYECSRGVESIGLWKNFVKTIGKAATFRTGFITSFDQFNHSHFWFLTLLLSFFVVFALLHHGRDRRSIAIHSEIPSDKSIISILVLICVITTILTLLMFLLFGKDPSNREPWIIIASVIQFQTTRVLLYIICFGLGIYAFHKNWLSSGLFSQNLFFWIVITILLMIGKEIAFASLVNHFTPIVGIIHVALKSFLVFSIIMTLMAFGGKCWNNGNKLNRVFARNSYIVYLIHFVIVLSIQLLMYKWLNVSIYFKFVIGSILSIVLSFLLSEFVVRRYPKSSILGMISLFGVLVLV
jgi:glucans biosynthesis protein C